MAGAETKKKIESLSNPNVADLYRPKALSSRQSPAFGGKTVLASSRTSRTVKVRFDLAETVRSLI
ncbi:MAG: hypothetical protein OES18_04805 [Deltaproteobacteria bacterium]|nr:hypothetical protein [Deltaproteobacteria bacterium]